MIRINLLGQIRPKAARRAPTGEPGGALPVVFILGGVVLGVLLLFGYYVTLQKDLAKATNDIKLLRAQKTELELIKQQVESFERQKVELQKRIGIIEQLQRDRTGGQELLDMVANTVSRTENLWLTSLVRKGSALSIEGSSATVNSVANFITQLKRSGYFQKIEIKEAKQDDKNVAIQTFNFQMTAEIAPPQPPQARPAQQAKPASTNPPQKPAAPARKG